MSTEQDEVVEWARTPNSRYTDSATPLPSTRRGSATPTLPVAREVDGVRAGAALSSA
jgi:hypothetical protein